jgi:hypothetical protein
MGKPPVPKASSLPSSLIFNPNIVWDPVPWEWTQLDPGLARDLTRIRLEHQKEVLALQSRALDKALNAVNKAGR